MKIEIRKTNDQFTATDLEKGTPIAIKEFPEYLELKTDVGSKFLTKKKFVKIAQNDVAILEKSEEHKTRTTTSASSKKSELDQIRENLEGKDLETFQKLIEKALSNKQAKELKAIDDEIARLMALKKSKEGA